MRNARHKQRADVQTTDADGTRAELNQFDVLLCLPTAPVLPLKKTETSVGIRFLDNFWTSYCLAFVDLHGGTGRKPPEWVENKSAEPSRPQPRNGHSDAAHQEMI